MRRTGNRGANENVFAIGIELFCFVCSLSVFNTCFLFRKELVHVFSVELLDAHSLLCFCKAGMLGESCNVRCCVLSISRIKITVTQVITAK